MVAGAESRTPDRVKDLTTGEFAKLRGLAPRTVMKLIDEGRLPGAYKIPGPNGEHHRRIPVEAALRFLREHGMPVPPSLLPHGRRVVLVGLNPLMFSGKVESYECAAQAGAAMGVDVYAVACSLLIGRAEVGAIALLARERNPGCGVAVVVGDDGDPADPGFAAAGVAVFRESDAAGVSNWVADCITPF